MATDPDRPVIVLTTDFGVGGAYVGVMKGVILTLNPRATIIDLTHQISPQNIREGAFILGINHRFFPSDAIHVAVVDPEVGTGRLALLLVTPRGRFLAPDNGLLSNVVWDTTANPPVQEGPVALPSGCSAYRLTERKFWLDPVSDTFQGRDVFAPVAAHLSLGVSGEQLGQPVYEIHRLATPQPSGHLPRTVQGQVVYADHFGNLVTNIDAARLLRSGEITGKITVEINGRRIQGLSRTFHDTSVPAANGLIALVGSHGYLEIAVRDGSAARLLQAGAGETVGVTGS